MNEMKVSRKLNREKWESFGQNWSGKAMEDKEKEILDPRKVFFFSLGK